MPVLKPLPDIIQPELAAWKSNQWLECVRNPTTKKPVSGSQPGADAVAKYWQEGLGDFSRNGCSDFAWSAAFICWTLRQAGVKLDEFPFFGTKVSPDKITAVGGNVADRLKESTFGAVAGILKPKKELICILRLAG
jgi:hypothetical protein